MKKTKNLQSRVPNDSKKSFQLLVQNNFYELLKDILVPVRVILATFFVFFAFLITDQALIWVFERLTQSIRLRSPFISWLLDGAEISSTISIAIYFVISGISNLRAHWQISKQIERRAGLP